MIGVSRFFWVFNSSIYNISRIIKDTNNACSRVCFNDVISKWVKLGYLFVIKDINAEGLNWFKCYPKWFSESVNTPSHLVSRISFLIHSNSFERIILHPLTIAS